MNYGSFGVCRQASRPPPPPPPKPVAQFAASSPRPPPATPPRPPTTPPRLRVGPPSAKLYDVLPYTECPGPANTVFNVILRAVEELFSSPDNPMLHNASFWTTFFHTVVIDISVGLMIRQGYVRSEAEVRCKLITPLLRKVAHSISTVSAPDGCEGGSIFSSILNIEPKTEERANFPGAKPRVDYTLMGYVHDKPALLCTS